MDILVMTLGWRKTFQRCFYLSLLATLFHTCNTFGFHEGLDTCQDNGNSPEQCADGVTTRICIPMDYMKFELPEEGEPTLVSIGVDIKDIPKVNDKDFSITLNAYFIVKWKDSRLTVCKRNKTTKYLSQDNLSHDTTTISYSSSAQLTAVNLHLLKSLWLPDVEILNLKTFETLTVLSKLEGIWIDKDLNLMYALATRITFICPMKFNAFPMDVQRCKFQVGSFNYDMSKMIFRNEFVPDHTESVKSILDYQIQINDLLHEETHYMALGMNYSVAGFRMVLNRKMSFYIVTYYLPSGLFVMVSWISFLVNPDVIPGRMTLLVTIFLVLVNIFNTIQTNSPKAEGLTAIEAWVIACIIFVFGALSEYTVLLLKIKLERCFPNHRARHDKMCFGIRGKSQVVHNTTFPINSDGLGFVPCVRADGKQSRHYCEMELDNLSGSNQTLSRPRSYVRNGMIGVQKDHYSRIDLTFLVVFPLLFVIFNLCYWTTFYVWRSGVGEEDL